MQLSSCGGHWKLHRAVLLTRPACGRTGGMESGIESGSPQQTPWLSELSAGPRAMVLVPARMLLPVEPDADGRVHAAGRGRTAAAHRALGRAGTSPLVLASPDSARLVRRSSMSPRSTFGPPRSALGLCRMCRRGARELDRESSAVSAWLTWGAWMTGAGWGSRCGRARWRTAWPAALSSRPTSRELAERGSELC